MMVKRKGDQQAHQIIEKEVKMLAIGHITNKKNILGKTLVNLWIDGEERDYGLINEEVIPDTHPLYGLFSFDPQDQFCRWVKPSEIHS